MREHPGTFVSGIVFTFIGVISQVAHICYILDVRNTIAEVAKIPNQYIEADVTFCMS